MVLIVPVSDSSSSTADPNSIKVLRLTGQTLDDQGRPQNSHAYHGLFWPRGINLGFFIWEAWVKPTSSGYLISDGYGGAHALLWGFNNGVPGAQHGNIFTGATTFSFGGRYVVALGEWVHIMVVWDGTHIYTYINGVPDSKQAFAGPRQSNVGPENGHLYVGGSDHLNGGYDLAFLRGLDHVGLASLPFSVENAFYPDRTAAKWTASSPSDADVSYDFICDYTQGGPSSLIDQSPKGTSHNPLDLDDKHQHHGRLFTTKGAASFWDIFGGNVNQGSLPEWVIDNDCPFNQYYDDHELPDETIPVPSVVPDEALFFDSFGRRNQTYAFQPSPSLNSVEYPDVATPEWQAGIIGGALRTNIWGILGGQAVFLGTAGEKSVAWIETEISDQDVRVTRDNSTNGNGEVGLCFRLVDQSNFWHVYYNQSNKIQVSSVTVGEATLVDSMDPDTSVPTWTVLRATCVGTLIRIFVSDDGTDWIQIGDSIDSAIYQAATKAGIATSAPGAGNGLARYKDFAVHLGVEAFLAGVLSAGNPTEDEVELSWTASQFGDALILEQLQRSPTGAETWANIAGATVSPFTDIGLDSSTSYDYRVRYTDSTPDVVYSNTVTVITDDPPSTFVPTDLGIKLKSWTPVRLLGLADNDPIAQLTDQSGLGNHGAAAGAARPTFKAAGHNGLAYGVFDGVGNYVDSNYGASILQPRTVFYVLHTPDIWQGTLTDAISGNRQLVGIGFDNEAFWVWTYYSGSGPVNGTIRINPGGVNPSSPHILVVQFNGATSKAWVNGELDVAENFGALDIGIGPRLGANLVPGNYWAGRFYEKVDCVNLTDAEINEVGNYLATIYDLTWNDI